MRFSLFRLLISFIPIAGSFTFVKAAGHSTQAGALFAVVIGIPLVSVTLFGSSREVIAVAIGFIGFAVGGYLAVTIFVDLMPLWDFPNRTKIG